MRGEPMMVLVMLVGLMEIRVRMSLAVAKVIQFDHDVIGRAVSSPGNAERASGHRWTIVPPLAAIVLQGVEPAAASVWTGHLADVILLIGHAQAAAVC